MKSFVLILRDVKKHAASRAIAIFENLGNNNLWKRIIKNVAATTIAVIKNDPAAAYAIKGIFLSVALITHGFFRSKTPRLFVFVLLLIIVTIVTLTSTSTAVKSVSVTQILYPILLGTGANLLVNLCVFPEFSSSFLGKTTIDTLHETTSALDKAGDYFIGLQKKQNPSELEFHRPHPQEKGAKNVNRHSFYLIHRMITSLVYKAKDQPTKGNTLSGQAVSLHDLTSSKAKLRTRLGNCKAAQSECNFELAFGVLPPENLKPISTRSMKRLVANTIAVIGACESKFALVGDKDAGEADLEESNRDYQSRDSKDLQTGPHTHLQPQLVKNSASAISKPHSQRSDIDLIKPKREIEFADVRLLQDLLTRVEKPYKEFIASIKQAVACITISIACSYDVPTLPSGARKPQGIAIEEIGVYIDEFKQAMRNFDLDVMSALEGVNTGQEMEGQEPDILPREEIFLISSFLLNIRQASTHLEDMLKNSHNLVLQRQERHARRRLYAPHIKWSKWLYSGGEEEESMPANARKEHRQSVRGEQSNKDAKANLDESDDGDLTSKRAKDVENDAGLRAGLGEHPNPQNNLQSSQPKKIKKSRQAQSSLSLQLRGKMADIVEWIQSSDDLLYAFKLAFGVILVTWPAFVAKWNSWYSLNRGGAYQER
ncbi:MAG: hypothetical protein Q9214_001140 [Letrouitia sp. 1 TL-2023]